VRDHAEQRALGRIGSLRRWKNNQINRKLGVIGCMAQRLSEELFHIKPHIDFSVQELEMRASHNGYPCIW